jgi:hypothetical protein
MEIYVKQYPVTTPIDEYKAIIRDLGLDPCGVINFQVVVQEGYDSPYKFGELLRNAVECESAEIYRVDNVYFVINDENADSVKVAFCESTILNSVAKIPSDACRCVKLDQNIRVKSNA